MCMPYISDRPSETSLFTFYHYSYQYYYSFFVFLRTEKGSLYGALSKKQVGFRLGRLH